jgi:hypothetical protein
MSDFRQVIPNIELKKSYFENAKQNLLIIVSKDGKDRSGYIHFLVHACFDIIEGLQANKLIIDADNESYLRKFVNSMPELDNFEALCEQLSWTDHVLRVVSDVPAGTSRPIVA